MDHTANDIKLWEDFKKGEKYALSHIYYQYANLLFFYGKKFTTDDELIKDSIQDLFFDLIRTRATLGNTDHIYFYLIKSLRRRLLQSLNGNKNIKITDADFENHNLHIVYSIEEDLILKEELTQNEKNVRKGLAELSPKQREILYYRFTCDFEYDQICEIMSMKYDSARKMVFRALKTLRTELSETSFTFIMLYSPRISTVFK